MRRALALTALAAAAFAAGTPAAAAPVCEPLTREIGLCYQVADCPEPCRAHVIVDPTCADHLQTPWCRAINGVRVDSDTILDAIGS